MRQTEAVTPRGSIKKRLYQKETPAQVFSSEFCVLKRDSSTGVYFCILKNFSEQLFKQNSCDSLLLITVRNF